MAQNIKLVLSHDARCQLLHDLVKFIFGQNSAVGVGEDEEDQVHVLWGHVLVDHPASEDSILNLGKFQPIFKTLYYCNGSDFSSLVCPS